ncbi:hypothetical protein DY000_02048303 [Brassica cretica]|uniref:EF-hand domain-containing protein n=1 Tax=Brassica cretica TaxID=69181 RepID=A0ABQ7F4F3_BRACR|nr:hypothetical protein DY000_02048303 [Brassica cretica]
MFAKQIFEKFNNKNKNGKLSLDEFLEAVLAFSLNISEEEVTQMFKEIDVDGDGELSSDEFASSVDKIEFHAAMIGPGKECTEEKCAEMVKTADVDGDGYLSFEEFMRARVVLDITIFRGAFRRTSGPRNVLGDLFPRNSIGKFRGISEERRNSEELFPRTCFVVAVKETKRVDNKDDEEEVTPADDRTVFLTFSKGYPISESEVRVHFTRKFGEVIEAIVMQEVQENEQPLFARMVLKMEYASKIEEIVTPMNKNKFTIDGKHVLVRKFFAAPSSSHVRPPS